MRQAAGKIGEYDSGARRGGGKDYVHAIINI